VPLVTIPSRADLKVGYACNNRCVFCVQGDRRERVAPLTTAQVMARMEEVRPRHSGLVLTGGEVTVRKDFFDLLRAARDLGFAPVQVQTNGRRFHDIGFCVSAIHAGATEFSPALHGATAPVHDALTRSRSFDQTVAGIHNLLRLGQGVITNTVVTLGNLDDLVRIVRLVHALGVRHAQFALVHPLGAASRHWDEVVPRLAEAAGPMAEAVREGRRRGLKVVTEALPPCLLGDVADAAVESEIPETEVLDAEFHLADYTRYRVEEGKRKGARCRECRLDPVCEGPWREYVDRYGEEDLRPVPRA